MSRNSSRPDLGRGGFLEQFDRYPVTYGLLLANGILFGFLLWKSGGPGIDAQIMFLYGGFVPEFAPGQPWRGLTAGFLHFDLLHLALNMIGLFFVGRFVELHFGSPRAWVLYLACMAGGALANLGTFHLSQTLKLGASGGISAGASNAVIGWIALAFFFANNNSVRLGSVAQQLQTWLIYIVAATLILSSQIDVAGHIGGGLMGALLAQLVQPKPGEDVSPNWTYAAHALSLVVLGCFALMVQAARASLAG